MKIGLLQVRCTGSAYLTTQRLTVLNSLMQGACFQINKGAHNLPKVGYSGYGQEHKKESDVILDGRNYKIGRRQGRLV